MSAPTRRVERRDHVARRAARAAPTGPLAGRTLLVKDLIDTAGIRTTYGSRVYADHVPLRNATVVDRVLDAGATVVGKANLVEFAWGVARHERVVRHRPQPGRPGRTTGRLVERERGRDRGGPLRPRDRYRHGVLGSAARGRVRDRRSQDALGGRPDRRGLPAAPLVRHGRADGDAPCADAAALWSVLTGRPSRRRGSTG